MTEASSRHFLALQDEKRWVAIPFALDAPHHPHLGKKSAVMQFDVLYKKLPIVPRKMVAEVSKLGNL